MSNTIDEVLCHTFLPDANGERCAFLLPLGTCFRLRGDSIHPSISWNDISMVPHSSYFKCTCPPGRGIHGVPIDCVKEQVDHPLHYGGEDNPHEHIKCAVAWGLDDNAFLYQCTKYIARLGKKAGTTRITDLKKAAWYLQRAIEKEEKV